MTTDALRDRVARLVRAHPVVDMHTHLFAPAFDATETGSPPRFLLSGIDELLNYHYLTAELFRAIPSLHPDRYFAMPPTDRADLVWKTLFVDRPPISESCRGVITTLTAFGLDPNEALLNGYRSWFAARDLNDHVDDVMRLAGVERITMTNEVFDPAECRLWLEHGPRLSSDSRFDAVVRIDALLTDWPGAVAHLRSLGYEVAEQIDTPTVLEVRRFLHDWITRTGAVYVAASLPPTWQYPGNTPADQIIDDALLPVLEATGLPLALMIGVRRGVNPALRSAGDGVGLTDIQGLCRLAERASPIRLLVTVLSDGNQHELCVAARKFANITPFGCWWFLNTPEQIERITRTRLELLGTTFIPQHSDARVLEQLIYKWSHSRDTIASVLADHFVGLESSGYALSDADVSMELDRMFRGNYEGSLRAGRDRA